MDQAYLVGAAAIVAIVVIALVVVMLRGKIAITLRTGDHEFTLGASRGPRVPQGVATIRRSRSVSGGATATGGSVEIDEVTVDKNLVAKAEPPSQGEAASPK